MKHILPNISDWPIYHLSERRQQFIKEINSSTFQHFQSLSNEQLQEVLDRTIYLERNRVKNDPWQVDPPNEAQFWSKLGKRLNEEANPERPGEYRVILEELLRIIINRYSHEIVGSFKINTFLFARKFLTVFFNVIFNPLRGRYLLALWTSRKHARNKLRVFGQLERIRKLSADHIPVITPTHSSNLDSILIGYMIDMKTGLPGFSYGAGLNLYNSGVAAYFMNRLGAYRVDRRKKNAIYLETLKTMSHLSMVQGTNSLFFPGGTRSRSNHIESKLKTGLLSTTVDAQRTLCEQGDRRKIVIIPLILSNHFVLEAKSLVEQHLRTTGKERYIRMKERPPGIWGRLRYVNLFFRNDTEAVFMLGEPFDVFGNKLDDQGISTDARGRKVDICDYFRVDDQIVRDPQREIEYTKLLADHIAERYHKEQVVLSSHIVSYAAFQYILRRSVERLDLFSLIKMDPKTVTINEQALLETVTQLKALIQQRTAENTMFLDPLLKDLPAQDILRQGMDQLGIYHLRRPLRRDRKGRIYSSDLKLLYFYHNRLDGYGLAEEMFWKKILSYDPASQHTEDLSV